MSIYLDYCCLDVKWSMTLYGSKLILVQKKVDGTFQNKEKQYNTGKTRVVLKTTGGRLQRVKFWSASNAT